MSSGLTIAIDGPAGAGKGTLARRHGETHLDHRIAMSLLATTRR